MNELKEIKQSFAKLSQLNLARNLSKAKQRKKRLKPITKLERIDDLEIDPLLYQEKGSLGYRIMKELRKDLWSRNISLVFDLLQRLPNFVTFTQYYNISDNAIRQIVSIAKLRLLNKDEVLLRLQDQCENFYIIIKGTIIIQQAKLGTEELLDDKVYLSSGHCFGEFGLLYSIPRPQKCIADEETILFYITGDNFNKILKKLMLKSELDRKILVSTILPSVKYISQKKFLSLCRYFVFQILKKNDIVFQQGEIADSIYLIQYGKCRLLKDNRHILTMGKNDFVGLEAIDNDPCVKVDSEKANEEKGEKDKVRYDYSLYCHENCIILKIKLSALGDQYYQVKRNIDLVRKTKESILMKYNEMNEKYSFHQYQYLSHLNKQSKNTSDAYPNAYDNATEEQTKALFKVKQKTHQNHNSVSMKKSNLQLDIIQKGMLKPNHQHLFSDPSLRRNNSITPFSTSNFVTSLNKRNSKSRNSPNKIMLIEKLYGNTSEYKLNPINNTNKMQLYQFNTGTCSLPLLTLYG